MAVHLPRLTPLRHRKVATTVECSSGSGKKWNSYPYCGHSVLVGKKERPRQDGAYVLGYFGRIAGQREKAYLNFMEGGIAQGRREDLTGGGLIRSVGGWLSEVKQLKRHEHVMSGFWVVKELGISIRELARRLALSPPAIGYSVERGKAIARQNRKGVIKSTFDPFRATPGTLYVIPTSKMLRMEPQIFNVGPSNSDGLT